MKLSLLKKGFAHRKGYPAAALIIWLAVTYALSFQVGPPSIDNTLDIRMDLPSQLGKWRGHKILYCQDITCGKYIIVSDSEPFTKCPACGAALAVKSPAEKQVLPEEVEIARQLYTRSGRESILVTIVAGGTARESIHRPQRCLTAQGATILNSRVEEISIPDRESPLKVMVLETMSSQGPSQRRNYLAYWFVGQGKETPYNLERMFWIAWDRLFKHKISRWAYVSLAGTYSSNKYEQTDKTHELTMIKKIHESMVKD